MPPVGFSDEEMDLLTSLASALPPPSRDAFLKLVANSLSAYPLDARGLGLLHRLASEAQRAFTNVAVGVGRSGKYGRIQGGRR